MTADIDCDAPYDAQSPFQLAPQETDTKSGDLAAIMHIYRAEMQRANAWLARLDQTTYWAVVSTTALLTFTLASPSNPHGVLLLAGLMNLFFLFIEARRYRNYDVWHQRLQLFEHYVVLPLLQGRRPTVDERSELIRAIEHPRFRISVLQAAGRRLRRTYGVVFTAVLLAWIAKLSSHPEPSGSIAASIARASIDLIPGMEPVPGWAVVGFIVLGYMAIVSVSVLTVRAGAICDHVQLDDGWHDL